MTLLLDTCVFLWMTGIPEKLSAKASNALKHLSNTVLLSPVSIWEITLKNRKQKLLSLDRPVIEFVKESLSRHEISELPLKIDHLEFVERLPNLHSDPFDRILISQALSTGCTIITPDSEIHRYPVPVLW